MIYTGPQEVEGRLDPISGAPFHRAGGATIVAIIATALYLVCADPLSAQERVRTAAGPLAIESFKRKPEVTFRLGPFDGELSGSAGFNYTDNADLTNTGKVSGFSLYQSMSLDATWVLSHLSQLEIVFGGNVTENFYGNGQNNVTVGIPPGKIELQFPISDLMVRLFDGFSYVQNPTSNPAATNTANLYSLTNTIGAAVDADLGIAILSFSGDYTYNNQNGSNVQGQTNPATTGTRNTLRLGSDLTFRLSPQIVYGISTVLTRSTGSGGGTGTSSGNVTSFNVGPFIHGRLSRVTDFNLAGGAILVHATPSEPPGYYFSGVLLHQLSRHWQLILSVWHDLVFTTGTTGLTEESTFRAATQINLTRFITFTAAPLVNFGDVKSGPNSGSFTQYGFETGLGWNPRKHWYTGLTYNFIRRNGTSASDSYIQNSVAFELGYRF
jgi:hypothetical protein